ncbi:ABC-three component system protein [Rhizobium sp. RAF36]|uniref:ABC-three component system protein n=1 Tax=Rhizobium sp. RAF36 TaxID=3233055 RepID=UPI003F95DD89
MSLVSTSDLSKSHVSGDQAGNNITKITNYNQIDGAKPSQVNRLLKLLSDQISKDESMVGFVDDLQFFIDNRDGEAVVGLKDKLEVCGRGAAFNDAKKKKELFAKLLMRFERFSSAQQLFAYIMAAIHETFDTKIIPSTSSLTAVEIDAMIESEIVDKVMAEIGEGSDHMTLNRTHIKGMIYWLADKCYVRWHCD